MAFRQFSAITLLQKKIVSQTILHIENTLKMIYKRKQYVKEKDII